MLRMKKGSSVHRATPVRPAAQWAPPGVSLLSEAVGVPISVLSPRILPPSLCLALLALKAGSARSASSALAVPRWDWLAESGHQKPNVNFQNNHESLGTFK